jgi:thiamine biosynthesis lipoprotein ApbE
VTVLSDTVEEAEVLAKAAFLFGFDEGRRFLRRQAGIAAVLVRPDGRVDIVGNLEIDRAA